MSDAVLDVINGNEKKKFLFFFSLNPSVAFLILLNIEERKGALKDLHLNRKAKKLNFPLMRLF